MPRVKKEKTSGGRKPSKSDYSSRTRFQPHQGVKAPDYCRRCTSLIPADQVQQVFNARRKAGLSPHICFMRKACSSHRIRITTISALEQSASSECGAE